MNKVGVITFHDNYNYGAALQCASVCELIRDLGGDPTVIDFAPFEHRTTLFRGWGFRKFGIPGALKKRFYDTIYGKRTRMNFNRFRNQYWETTAKCQDNEDIAAVSQGFSYVVAGSDQVWRFDRPSAYFLEWGSSNQPTRVSYAPCCTNLEQPGGQEENIRKWLGQINFLSVRNDFSREAVKSVSGLTAKVVADPTFLVDFPKTDCLPANIPDEYILVYMLGSEIRGGMANLLAKAKGFYPGASVVAVCPTMLRPPNTPWADLVLHGQGPFEWVELIRSASLVITDSFHGTIFSIKSEKPFISFYEEEIRAPRLLDLSRRYEVQKNTISSVQEAEDQIFVESPSAITKKRVSDHCELSQSFLNEAFAGFEGNQGR